VCGIQNGTTCASGGSTFNVPPGSRLSIEVIPQGDIDAFDLLFGWRATSLKMSAN
jgi:hypothetical protein